MAYFHSPDEVYSTLGQLFRDAASSNGVGALLRQANASVRLSLSDPSAAITLAFAEDESAIVDFGSSSVDPVVTLESSADTAHELFVGTLDFADAIATRRLVGRGASPELAGIWASLDFTLPNRYAQILSAAGRDDLVPE